MNTSYRKLLATVTALATLGAGACSDDGEAKLEEPTAFELRFRMVDEAGNDFACGASGLEVAGLNDVTPNDARLYIHDLAFVDVDGREVPVTLDQDVPWQHEGVVLLDFEDGTAGCEFVIFGRPQTAETNQVARGKVEGSGPWSGVSFSLGVPIALNHLEVQTAPAPLNVTGMDHGPADGRQFVRVSFFREADVEAGDYHLFSFRSVCNALTAGGEVPDDAEACAKPNRPRYNLTREGGFDPETHTIVFDVGALFADYTTPGSPDGPHPDLNAGGRIDCFSPLHAGDLPGGDDTPPTLGAERCGRAYPPLGLDYATGRASSTPQRVFSIR